MDIEIDKFHFEITGSGYEAVKFVIVSKNESDGLPQGVKFFEKLSSLGRNFIFKIFKTKMLLTSDLKIVCKHRKYELFVCDQLLHVIEPNSPDQPCLINLEPIGNNHLHFLFNETNFNTLLACRSKLFSARPIHQRC